MSIFPPPPLPLSISVYVCPSLSLSLSLSLSQRNVTLYQLLSQLRQGLVGSFSHALTTSFESVKLNQLLDRGASGEVYRGNWQENDVAIKVLKMFIWTKFACTCIALMFIIFIIIIFMYKQNQH